MAPTLDSLPNETLALILGQFCAHCSKAHEDDNFTDNFPDDHFRPANRRCGQQDEHEDPDEPLWYSRTYRNSLYSMCLVSKRLRPVAQSVLYHEFVPGYGDHRHRPEVSWGRRLSSFVRTIAARPDLAAVVKRAFVHCFLLRPVTEAEAQATLSEVIGPGTHEYLAHFKDVQDWGRNPALQLLGLLLALAPSLDRLSLQVDNYCLGIPAGALSALGGLLQSRPLAKLKTLDVCDRSGYFSLEYHAKGILETVGSAFATLNLHMCSSTRVPLQKKLHNISTIRITHSQLRRDDLTLLFQSCAAPSLKSFLYETVNPLENMEYCIFSGSSRFSLRDPFPTKTVHTQLMFNLTVGGYDHDANHFQPSDAIRHLRLHKTTLESLHLDLRGIGRPGLRGAGDERPLSETLRDFPTLKHVFISTSMLYNHRGKAPYATDDSELLTALLPPTITSLHLAGTLGTDTPRLARALLHLARMAGAEFKTLRSVRCDVMAGYDGLLDDYEIEETFAAIDVDFGYNTFPLSEPAPDLGDRLPPRSEALWPVDWDSWCPSDGDDDL